MKTLVALASAAAITVPAFAAPQVAVAQSYSTYGSGDICAQQKRSAGVKGAVAGGLLGAFVGSQMASRGARTEGSVLGGALGAAAGYHVGKSSVRCLEYPDRIASHRSNCRWVQEYTQTFEVCRGRDGVWRPSGRS